MSITDDQVKAQRLDILSDTKEVYLFDWRVKEQEENEQ